MKPKVTVMSPPPVEAKVVIEMSEAHARILKSVLGLISPLEIQRLARINLSERMEFEDVWKALNRSLA